MDRKLSTVVFLFLILGPCTLIGGISVFHGHSSMSLVDGNNGLTESSLEHLQGVEDEDKRTSRDKVNDILHGLMYKYDNRVRPFYPKDRVLVNVDLEFVRIDDVLERGNRELVITFLIHQTWSDPRLVFLESGYDELDEIDRVTLANDHIRELWLPDTCIPNEKMSSDSGESSVEQDFVVIYKNGSVTRSSLMMISTNCAFDYGGFPFDRQICSLELGSYSYRSSEVSYIWDSEFILRVNNFPESGLLSDDKYVSGFVITGVEVNEMEVDQKSRLVFGVNLQRMWRVYIGRYYLPMVLFVFGSVGGLFFEKGKRAVAWGVVNLALVNVFVAVRSSAPDIPTTSAFTSYDRYFMICLLYMCVVLVVSVYRSTFGDEMNCRKSYSGQETMVLRRQSCTSSRRESVDVFSTMGSDGGDRYDEIEEAVGRDSDAIYRSTSYVIGSGGQSKSWVRLKRVGWKGIGWVSKYLKWILVVSFLLTDYIYFKVHSVTY